MKVLLFGIGTRGDVQPFVALGRGLAARGHDVTLAAPRGFAPMVEAAGLQAAKLPADTEELMQTPEIQAAMASLSGRLRAFSGMAELMNRQLGAVWEIGHAVRPDVILAHVKAGLAPYLGRSLGVPTLPVYLQPGMTPTGDYPNFLVASRSLGRLGNRASHALIQAAMRGGTAMMIRRWEKATGHVLGPRMVPIHGFSPGGCERRLHAYSPTLFPRPVEWDAVQVQPGYLFTEPEDWTPPPALAAFLAAGDRPIYVGFGSMPGIDHARTTNALLGALERTGLRAVVATGWGGIAGVATDGAVHVVKEAPHSWLFPRMAAVVHHGGSGTAHEGLRWGRPSVICPLFGDQPFFGARVADLGAGPEPIRQKSLTADGLARALERALSPDVTARAAEIGTAIRAENGVARAIEVLEEIMPAR